MANYLLHASQQMKESSNLLDSNYYNNNSKDNTSSKKYDSMSERCPSDVLPQQITDDDAVSIAIKRLCLRIILCVVLWLLSYILVMIQIIDKGKFMPFTAFLFLPMWIGSTLMFLSILIILRQVLYNGPTLISKEQRLYMISESINVEKYMSHESLHLIRILFFWSYVIGTFVLLAFSTQILIYLWVVAGVIGMWHALLPVLAILVVFLVYSFLVDTLSLVTCCGLSSVFIGIVSRANCIFSIYSVLAFIISIQCCNMCICRGI